MGERKRIGLIFSYNENWIGGTYYLLNIIHALNHLEDRLKPSIVILSPKQEDYSLVKKETAYPYLEFEQFPRAYTIPERVINKVSWTLYKKHWVNNRSKLVGIDFVYPNFVDKISSSKIPKCYWIPDFQEIFLPELFSAGELKSRGERNRMIAESGDCVVFSSENAKSHFNQFFPDAKPVQYVLPFAVTHPDFRSLDSSEVLKKHKLSEGYFFCPNQFWIHKNHMIVLKAVNVLKERGVNVKIAFSGKDYDHRNKDYVDSLKSYISENDLIDNFTFLGFIDREDQLCILENSLSVIQPSLFEGWSTVVEDSKAIGKHIILSNLDVHQEQIKENCLFFDPRNELDLASKIEQALAINVGSKLIENQYQKEVERFGTSFINMVNEMT